MVKWGKSCSLSLVIVLAGCTLNTLEYSILARLVAFRSRTPCSYICCIGKKKAKKIYEVPTLLSLSGENNIALFPEK